MGESVKTGFEPIPVASPHAGRFSDRPLLVFWEMTRACDLACRHCRASAQRLGAPDELSLDEGRALIDELSALGSPRPILILTGGDCFKRRDLFALLDYAGGAGVPVALAPSVTPLLNVAAMKALRAHGVRSVSLSLDGSLAATHDEIRGVTGHFDATLDALRNLKRLGFTVQVNTTVMRPNVTELASIAALLVGLGVNAWEVFFVVTTGRATSQLELAPDEIHEVCEFLVEASRYEMTVRTVEAPYFRRYVKRQVGAGRQSLASEGPLQLRRELVAHLGESHRPVRAPSVATRDGKGIIFISSSGEVFASGFLPFSLGNVRSKGLLEIYREHELLRQIRAGSFRGPCGDCDEVDLCGGSRARAFATLGDPLESDPACPFAANPSTMWAPAVTGFSERAVAQLTR